MKICDFLAMKTYEWRGIGQLKSLKEKVKRIGGQFTPYSWKTYDWAQAKSFKGYIAILTIITLELITELNCFYLKYLLWIPVESPLNTYRLIFLFFICLPAVREAYQFIDDPKCQRLGMNAWMVIVCYFNFLVYCIHRASHLYQIFRG